MFLYIIIACLVRYSETTETTTRTYEINVPNSESSIRIIEADPIWTEISRSGRKNSADFNPTEENFSPQALEQFLNTYADKLRRKHQQYDDPPESATEDDKEEKSKRWNLMHVHKHKHPFDDRNGWVSLDPVPWSLSKISKWHSEKRPKPQISYEDDDDIETPEEVPSRPSWYQKPYKVKPSAYRPFEENQNYKPGVIIHKPEFSLPETHYGHKIQVQYDSTSSDEVKKRPNRYGNHHDCDRSEEIITDGQPSNFPDYRQNTRRKSTEFQENLPFVGNGEWVLLSTTKGFKSPQSRQRSLRLPSNTVKKEADSVGFRKGVQLTVLPPLKGSKINMTTSHGGLLQVESTFETVEEAQQRHARKLKIKDGSVKNTKKTKVVRRPSVQKLNVALPISTVTRRVGNPDISAVLAAAGAGMIPATMAMLVPMAMRGKRRRRSTLSLG